MNYQSLRSLAIALLLAIVLTISSTATAVARPLFSPTSLQLAATNPLAGTAEKVEGKIRETVGNLKGDREAQIKGKVKQAEGNLKAIESDELSAAEIEGKTQQAESNIRRYQTEDRKAEDLKDALR